MNFIDITTMGDMYDVGVVYTDKTGHLLRRLKRRIKIFYPNYE